MTKSESPIHYGSAFTDFVTSADPCTDDNDDPETPLLELVSGSHERSLTADERSSSGHG